MEDAEKLGRRIKSKNRGKIRFGVIYVNQFIAVFWNYSHRKLSGIHLSLFDFFAGFLNFSSCFLQRFDTSFDGIFHWI